MTQVCSLYLHITYAHVKTNEQTTLVDVIANQLLLFTNYTGIDFAAVAIDWIMQELVRSGLVDEVDLVFGILAVC